MPWDLQGQPQTWIKRQTLSKPKDNETTVYQSCRMCVMHSYDKKLVANEITQLEKVNYSLL